MNISEKVIRYYDGEMTEEEKKEFENELEYSAILKTQADAYKKLLIKTSEAKAVHPDESYFSSVIPVFRLNQAKKVNWKPYPKFAVVITFAAALLFIIISYNDTGDDLTLTNSFSELTIEEIDSVFKYYPQYSSDLDSAITNDENYSDIVDDILLGELEVSEDNINSIYSYTVSDENQSYNNLSDEEAQIIYKEIINKSFF